MVKEHYVLIIFIGVIAGLAGFIMIFNSVSFGTSLAETWLANRADPSLYHVIIKSYINNFLVGGGVLSVFGLFLITFTSCIYEK
ncbi:hypothetical protein [Neobacillus terrae]|uniref:hypothetical protein n=1 Tax=Neobacillus terrae TaxID=3034837 RepID=UPI00140AD6C3|nr:hypothetical protein [Neobacillus terrae]NHM30952.1 hypothetical protein [Neobacillus terrae]